MPKSATRPVRLSADVAERIRLIAEYLTDTGTAEVSMGDLISKWAEPHIAKMIDKAIDHDIQKKQQLRRSPS